jgi:hypothetical protein
MRWVRWVRVLALAVTAGLVLASCGYQFEATSARDGNRPLPWWCNPTEHDIRVTEGPAAGTVDWYVGVDKAPLSWDDCIELGGFFDAAKTYAEQWPTRGTAEADGFREATGYIPGMGTHHIRPGITAALLNSPTFDKSNPILDSAGLDDVFDPRTPEVLQFDGSGPDAKLVGFDYYVRTSTGRPPEGFTGTNDWWHHHPLICFRKTDAAMVGFNVSNNSCTSMNGINVNMSNYYMLHVWIIDDMKFIPDVYAGMIPCIAGGTAVHDAEDPCHTSRDGMAGMDMASMSGL